MGFSRPGYWSGEPFPSPGDLPNPGIKPRFPTVQADSLPADPPGKPKNTGVGSLSLLQGDFPTQESNQGLLHCRRILYQLSHQGNPKIPEWVAYPFSKDLTDPTINITDEWGIFLFFISHQRKHGGSAGKESACNVGDLGLIPGLGRSPGEGKGYPLQHLLFIDFLMMVILTNVKLLVLTCIPLILGLPWWLSW